MTVAEEAEIKQDVLHQVVTQGLSECSFIMGGKMKAGCLEETVAIPIHWLSLHAVDAQQAV